MYVTSLLLQMDHLLYPRFQSTEFNQHAPSVVTWSRNLSGACAGLRWSLPLLESGSAAVAAILYAPEDEVRIRFSPGTQYCEVSYCLQALLPAIRLGARLCWRLNRSLSGSLACPVFRPGWKGAQG